MDEFTENDLRAIERDRDLPPDEPYDWAEEVLDHQRSAGEADHGLGEVDSGEDDVT